MTCSCEPGCIPSSANLIYITSMLPILVIDTEFAGRTHDWHSFSQSKPNSVLHVAFCDVKLVVLTDYLSRLV